MTPTPTPYTMPSINFGNMIFGGVGNAITSELNKQAWYHWPYWGDVFIIVGSLIFGQVTVWIWFNIFRKI